MLVESNFFNDATPELVENILSFLPRENYTQVIRVCKAWQEIFVNIEARRIHFNYCGYEILTAIRADGLKASKIAVFQVSKEIFQTGDLETTRLCVPFLQPKQQKLILGNLKNEEAKKRRIEAAQSELQTVQPTAKRKLF